MQSVCSPCNFQVTPAGQIHSVEDLHPKPASLKAACTAPTGPTTFLQTVIPLTEVAFSTANQ